MICTESSTAHTRKRSRRFHMLVLLVAALSVPSFLVDSAKAGTYYVDADGIGGPSSDSNPGTIDRPFKTIARAKEVICGTQGNTVYIRGGTYCLPQTLKLEKIDSGGPGAPNIYAAYAEEHPVILGSIRIPASAFVQHSGNILKANLTSYGITSVPRLFMNRQRLLPAQYPNYIEPDFTASDPYLGNFLHAAADTKPSTTVFKYRSGDFDPSRWTNIKDAKVNIFPTPNYGNNILGITSIDPATSLVTLASAVDYKIMPHDRYYFQHIFEELDVANEWYWDKANQTLYLYPERPLTASDVITVPVLNYVIFVSSASHIEFRGLTVGEAHEQGFVMHYPNSVTVQECEVLNSGSEGIGLMEPQNAVIRDCVIHATGTRGIYGAQLDPSFKQLISCNSTFTGNTIYDTGVIRKDRGSGIQLITVGATISWNHVFETARCGIEVKGNENIIEYNHVHDVSLETEDAGAIYLFGGSWVRRGNIVRYNYVHDTRGYGYDGTAWRSPYVTLGIYLDDFQSGTHVYGNTVVNCYRDSINVHSGRDNTIENNTVIGTRNLWHIAFKAWDRTNLTYDRMWAEIEEVKNSLNGWNGAEYLRRYPEILTIIEAHPPQDKIMCGNTCLRNIMVWTQGDLDLYRESWLDYPSTVLDENFVWSGGNTILTRIRGIKHPWDDWKALGFDLHSKDIAVTNSTPPSGYTLLVNPERTAKTFDLGTQSYRDVNDVAISGSITLQPFESKVLFTSDGGYALTTSAMNGSITKTPDKAAYAPGETVTLTAVRNTNYEFTGWSGDLTGTANPVTLVMDSNKSVTANFEPIVVMHRLEVTTLNGTVSKSPSALTYEDGTAVTLTATPAYGYTFSHWSGDASGTDPKITIIMDSYRFINANFVDSDSSNPYTLAVSAYNGTVTKSPDYASYPTGTAVTLTATPASGYAFSKWSGDASGTDPKTTVTMDRNKAVYAEFAALSGSEYTLTVSATNGTVTKSPNYASYVAGTAVTLTATPASGYAFSKWSGDASGTDPKITVTMDRNKVIYAEFVAGTGTEYTLTVSATNGTVTKSPNYSSYPAGTAVTLTATPAAGYAFSKWSGDATGTNPTITVTMDKNKLIYADFAAVGGSEYTLTVSATNGTVTKSPNYSSYPAGTVVTLTATPAVGYAFSKWSGDATGTSPTITVTMDKNKLISAEFIASGNGYTLTTTAVNGTVSKSPDKASYTSGEVVSLSAIANHGYHFSHWSGDLAGTSASTTITMNGNKSIVANFAPNTHTLTIKASNGTVIKTPDKARYDYGEVVTLQAVPDPGYAFSTWASAASGTANPTTITITSNTIVTAKFVKSTTTTTYPLTVSAANGSVTKTPDKTSYTSGETVTLQAVPAAGYSFAGWSGDLTGTTNPATLVMNSNKSVTANFKANTTTTYTLSVGAMNGSVTKSPDKTSYTSGETVTLQAVPAAGYSFAGWSGDLTGTTNPATVVMTSNKSVTANFTPTTYTLSVSATNGSVTKSPNKTSYTSGETVTLQAVPNTGYLFSGWSGDASGTSSSTTITMDANKTVAASFTANTGSYTLTTSATNGMVSVSPVKATYEPGEVVLVTALADYGHYFSDWSGDLVGTTASTSITMNGNKSIVANFSPTTHILTIKAAYGTVIRTPAKDRYDYGEVVTLQAVPDPGYAFSTWAGAAGGTNNPTTITITSNTVVAAKFVKSATASTSSLTVNDADGPVAKTLDQSSHTSGETAMLQTAPSASAMDDSAGLAVSEASPMPEDWMVRDTLLVANSASGRLNL